MTPQDSLPLAPKTDAEIARAALDILERDGWNQGCVTFLPADRHGTPWRVGSHCIGGAVNLALTGGTTDNWQHFKLAEDFYGRLYARITETDPDFEPDRFNHGRVISCIAEWNNNRPQERVIGLLEGMANA